MRGERKILMQILDSADIGWLSKTAHELHSMADLAALGNCDRDWQKLCELEGTCRNRIHDIKGRSVK